MPYLSTATHAELSSSNGQSITDLYPVVRTVFLQDAPFLASAPEPLVALAFAGIVAFDHAPYGPNEDMTLSGLLNAPTINCDDYCVLAIELQRLIGHDGGLSAAIVGWNGGAVGNHAQILASCRGMHMLLDPTTGLIALDVTLDGLCRGYPPMNGRWRSFFHPFQSGRTNIAAFEAAVRGAVLSGSFMAGNLLYYAPSLEEFRGLAGSSKWATPQSWTIK